MSIPVTLITGASSGMGAVCAKRFSHNKKLILASENLEALNNVKNECENSDQHYLWHCNFATERSQIFSSLCSLIEQNDLVITEYVHFAGLTQILPIKDFEISKVDLIFNVNFFSIIEILRVLLKKCNKKSINNVVLISALTSLRGDKCNSVYSASKGAINSLVYSLAQELAPAVRINAIMPGMTETPMSAKVNEAFLDEIWNRNPLGKGTPDDIVNYVEFLLSDKARWITGQTMFVDGGQSTF